MLILQRKIGESILIGDDITIVVNRVSGRRVSLGVSAPSCVRVVRGELGKVASGIYPEPASKPVCEQAGGSPGKSVGVTGGPDHAIER